MSDSQWMVTPKSREVLGPCLLGSVLQSRDVLTQTGLGGLASSSLMLDGNRWVSFLRGFLVHTFYVALNCKNYMHFRFVRNANKHLTTVQIAQSIKAKGQKCPFRSHALKKFEWWKRRPECVFCHFARLKFLKGWKCKSRKVILRRKGRFQAIKQWGKNMLGLRPDYAMWREIKRTIAAWFILDFLFGMPNF